MSPLFLVLLLREFLLLLRLLLAGGLRILLEEVQNLARSVGTQGLFLQTLGQVILCLGDCGDAFLEVLLPLLLDLVQLEEELLRVGAHLRRGPRLNRTFNKFPIFPVHHEG